MFPSVSDALFISDKRPRRWLISVFMRWYAWIVAGGATAIVLFSPAMYLFPLWTLGGIAAYWVYFLAKPRYRRVLNASPRRLFARALALTLAVTVFLWPLYSQAPYRQEPSVDDTLWLLYLLPVLQMAQRGITRLTLLVAAAACTAVLVLSASALPPAGPSVALVFAAVGKALWLGFLSVILYTLLRYLGDGYANLNFLHELAQRITAVRTLTTNDEKKVLRVAVREIAEALDYPHVNIFYRNVSGHLRCVAAACDASRDLEGITRGLPVGRGVLWGVAETGDHYIATNAETDPVFVRHELFPSTQSELAVPITLHDRVLGVLDVQSHDKNAFLEQDVRLMEGAARHLARAIEVLSVVASKERIGRLVAATARRLLSLSDVDATLQEIADAAREELGADVVVLYAHEPETGVIGPPIIAGEDQIRRLIGARTPEPGDLVYRLVNAQQELYIHEDVRASTVEDVFQSTTPGDGVPFVDAAGLRSRAVVHLRADGQCLGVIFLNFQRSRRFDDDEQGVLFTFAGLAALALAQARAHQREARQYQQRLAEDLHDHLLSGAFGIGQLLDAVLDDVPPGSHGEACLRQALEGVDQFKRDLRYLVETLEDPELDHVESIIRRVAKRAEVVYRVPVAVTCAGDPRPVPGAVANEVKAMVTVALVNATHHGRPCSIKVSLLFSREELAVAIADDGAGFDPHTALAGGGLMHSERRARRLGGTWSIDSSPGQGTTVKFAFPLIPKEEDSAA